MRTRETLAKRRDYTTNSRRVNTPWSIESTRRIQWALLRGQHTGGRRARIAAPRELATHDDPPSPLTPDQPAAARTGEVSDAIAGTAGGGAAAGAGAQASAPAAHTTPGAARIVSPALVGLGSFGIAAPLLLLGCLALTVPGAWFPRALPQSWPPP